VTSVATMAVCAPLVGLLGTVLGFCDSFPGAGASKSAILGEVTRRLSVAIEMSALGLLVGIAALVFFRYLGSRLEDFALEMQSARLVLLNTLSRVSFEIPSANAKS
jgi:biopolymer transport protein ExbB/TolQ